MISHLLSEDTQGDTAPWQSLPVAADRIFGAPQGPLRATVLTTGGSHAACRQLHTPLRISCSGGSAFQDDCLRTDYEMTSPCWPRKPIYMPLRRCSTMFGEHAPAHVAILYCASTANSANSSKSWGHVQQIVSSLQEIGKQQQHGGCMRKVMHSQDLHAILSAYLKSSTEASFGNEQRTVN